MSILAQHRHYHSVLTGMANIIKGMFFDVDIHNQLNCMLNVLAKCRGRRGGASLRLPPAGGAQGAARRGPDAVGAATGVVLHRVGGCAVTYEDLAAVLGGFGLGASPARARLAQLVGGRAVVPFIWEGAVLCVGAGPARGAPDARTANLVNFLIANGGFAALRKITQHIRSAEALTSALHGFFC